MVTYTGTTQRHLDWTLRAVRSGPLGGLWLFAYVYLAQLGHLIEHISVAIQGHALLGTEFDSELSHLLFNSIIAILSVALVLVYPKNPWTYPLVVLAMFHGAEHVYIYRQFLASGTSNGPGLLGTGGAIGLIPLDRIDLHNVYNGMEVVLLQLGLWHEIERKLA
jgi:hypothetical protein